MTDHAALARRRALALASQKTLSAPATTSTPATAEQLRMGWPLVWGTPEADLRMWVTAATTDPALTPGLRVALDAVLEAATAETAAALADAYDVAIEAEAQVDYDRNGWSEAADRCRLIAGLLGHVPSALLAAHFAEYTGLDSPDDWERRAILTTAAELRLDALYSAQGVPLRHTDRTTTRRAAWADLVSRAEAVTFWERLEQDAICDAAERASPAAVRDDTDFDPRDPDWDRDDEPAAEPQPPGIVVLESVEHLPGSAKDGSRPSGASTPRSEWAPIAGRRVPCRPVPDLVETHRFVVDEFPHAAALVERILRPLAGRPYARLAPVLLVGPPGCGKTRLAMTLASALGLESVLYSCAGASDAAFTGTSRQWSTGRASVPAQAIRRHGIANPVIVLDEVEKTGLSKHNGSLQDALLPMLDHANQYHDPYLECLTDLSGVSYIATANSLEGVSQPLRDRLRVYVMPEPQALHLGALARGIMRDLRGEMGLDEGWMPDLEGDELAIVGHHWRGGSIRVLRRLVETVIASRDHLAPRH